MRQRPTARMVISSERVTATALNPVGVWSLVESVEIDAQTGAVSRARGPNPSGMLVYTAGGTMCAIVTADGRTPLATRSDPESIDYIQRSAALFHTVNAYAGTYVVAGSRITHKVLVASNPGHPVLEYTVATARITYLRLVGWLPGRVKIERQALVEGKLTLRDPATGNVLWIADADHNLVDSFPQNQLPLVEDDRYSELKGAVPERNFSRVLEPVLVVAVVVGLVALFFQNRP